MFSTIQGFRRDLHQIPEREFDSYKIEKHRKAA